MKRPMRNNPLARRALRLESLEDRRCLSVTVATASVHGDNVLRITSDSSADTINIADSGDGHVEVTDGSGNVLGSADNVDAIRVLGGGGGDTVNYTLTGPLTHDEALSISLGGRDAGTANVDLSQGIQGARFFANVLGTSGDDNITTTLGNVTDGARANVFLAGGGGNDAIATTGTGVQIDDFSALDLRVDGGRGDDNLTTTLDAALQGRLSVATSGGLGTDTLATNLTVSSGSTGRLFARADGGAGTDNVTLNVNDNSGGSDSADSTLASVHAIIFDPGSVDTLTHTDNVDVLSGAGRGFGPPGGGFGGRGFGPQFGFAARRF